MKKNISSILLIILLSPLFADKTANIRYKIMLGVCNKYKSAQNITSKFPLKNTLIEVKNHKNKKKYYALIDYILTENEAKSQLQEVRKKIKDAYIIKYKTQKYIKKSSLSKLKTIKKDLKNKNFSNIHLDKKDNEESGISLKDAIELSLKKSYKINAAKEKITQAREKLNEKIAAYYPKVDLYANGGGAYLKPYKKGEVKFLKSDESLVITQNIYAGMKNINEVKREEENLKVAIEKYRDKVEEESLKIIDAYLSVIYKKKALQKAKENMQNLEKILDIVKTKEKNGAATKGDLNYIKSQVDNAKSAFVKVESKYKNALSFYEYFVGDLDESKMPKESEFNFKLSDLKNTLNISQDQNAKMCAAKHKLKASKYNLKAQYSKWQPKLDLSITAKDKQSGYLGEPQEDRATAMLQLSYNLYNGGKDKARLRSIKSQIRALQYQYMDIKRGLKHNVEQLYENVNSTKQTLEHTLDEKNANQKVVSSYWSAFKYGNQDLQALLLAQRALNRSELDLLKQKQLYINGYFKLLQQTGELLKKIGIKEIK